MATEAVEISGADATRRRIVQATADLLATGGRDAVSTRAVGAAAGVQAPTIYRLFGDKQGLLDAVATHAFTAYLEEKALREPGEDPVEDLRTGWDRHVEFGLANPAVFVLMTGGPRGRPAPPAIVAAAELLAVRVRRVAAAGRLRVPEVRAVEVLRAAGTGVTLTLIATDEARRDLALSRLVRDAVIAAITVDAPAVDRAGPAGAAIALRAVLGDAAVLSPSERALLEEWLDRLAGAGDAPAG